MTPYPMSPSQRRIAAACLVAGPVLFTISEALYPEVSGTGQQMLGQVAAHRGSLAAAAGTTFLAGLLFIPGLFGLLSRRMERGSALAMWGLALLYYGLIANVALFGINVSFYAMAAPSLDPSVMGKAVDSLPPSLVGPILLGHAVMALGTLLLGAGLWRSGVGPRWAAACVGLTGITDFSLGGAGLPEAVTLVAANGMLVAGFGAYAWLVLREQHHQAARAGLVAPAAPATA